MFDRLENLEHPADTCDPAIAPLVAEICAVNIDVTSVRVLNVPSVA